MRPSFLPWLVTLAALALAFIFGLGYLERSRELATLAARLEEVRTRSEGELAEERGKLAAEKKQMAVLQASAAADKPEKPGEASTSDQGMIRISMADFIRKHPEFADVYRAQARRNVLRAYGAALTSLNLPPTELSQLKDLLVERSMGESDARDAARQSGLSPQEQSAAVTEADREVDDEIKGLVGGDDFAKIREAPSVSNYKYQVDQFASDAMDAGAPLSSDQLNALPGLMYAAATAPKNPNLQNLTDSQAADAATGLSPADQALQQQAASLLSPAQLDALKNYQIESRREQSMMRAMRDGSKAGSLIITN